MATALLFVVMEGQADVVAATQMPDYDARRQYVYDTLVARADESRGPLARPAGPFPYSLHSLLPRQRRGGRRRAATQLLLRGRKDVSRILP